MNDCVHCGGTKECRYCEGSGTEGRGRKYTLDNFIACHQCHGTGRCAWCIDRAKNSIRRPFGSWGKGL